MTTLKNATTYGSDVLHYAGLKGEQDSGPLYFFLAHSETLYDLAAKIEYAVSRDEKVRPIVLDHLKATPEGDDLLKEYASLLAVKQKTPDQTVRQQALLDLQNQVNIQTLRNIETCKGIDVLIKAKRTVNIQRIQGTNKYACYVISTVKNSDGTQVEFIHVPFTATQLRKLGKLDKAVIDTLSTLSTADIRKHADSLKQGAANAEKGGTDALARTAIGKTAKALDAAISGTVIDGKLEGVSGATRNEVYHLWASLDATLSDTEKAKARAAYAELAAKAETPKVDQLKAETPTPKANGKKAKAA